MRSFLLLLKIQLLSLFGLNKAIHSNRQRARQMLALMVIVGIIVVAVICAYMACLGLSMITLGVQEAIPLLGMAIITAASFFMVLIKANGTLFALKDYDLLLSLPIPVRTIVLARLAPLYGLSLGLGVLVLLPLMVVYWWQAGVSAVSVLFTLLSLLLGPAIPTACGLVGATLIAFLSTRFRNANVVMGIGSMVLVVAFVCVVFLFTGNTSNGESATQVMVTTFADLGRFWPPAAWAASGMAVGDVAPFAAFCLVSTVVGTVTFGVVNKLFCPVNERLMGTRPRTQKVSAALKTVKIRTPFRALVAKEALLLMHTPIYLMNSCMGFVLDLVAAIGCAIATLSGTPPLGMLPSEYRPLVAGFLPWLLAFCLGMASTTSASVSLEGKSVWLMESAPVSRSTVLGAKLGIDLVLALPAALIGGGLLAFSFDLGAAGTAATILCGIAASLLGATLGLREDVVHANFGWSSPYEPVKRGVAVMVTVVGCGVFVIAGALSTAFFGEIATFVAAIIGIAISGLLWNNTVQKA